MTWVKEFLNYRSSRRKRLSFWIMKLFKFFTFSEFIMKIVFKRNTCLCCTCSKSSKLTSKSTSPQANKLYWACITKDWRFWSSFLVKNRQNLLEIRVNRTCEKKEKEDKWQQVQDGLLKSIRSKTSIRPQNGSLKEE